MITTMISRLLAASAYRKVIAVLLAGCVAGFVLGQAAHQPQARGIAAAVTSPARTASVIAGALGTPVVAPPPVIVPLSAPRPHADDSGNHGHVRDADPHNHVLPRAMPLGKPGHGHGHDDGGDGGSGGDGGNGGGDTSTPASPLSGGASVVTATLSVSN